MTRFCTAKYAHMRIYAKPVEKQKIQEETEDPGDGILKKKPIDVQC